MTRARLNPKLFNFIKNNPKVNITSQAIKNAISKIRRNNPGVTLNAAAYVFANKRGFNVMRFLDEEDRRSLLYLKPKTVSVVETKKIRKLKAKIKEISPHFGKKYTKDANKNAAIYPYVYILENSLRDLILEKFKSEKDWWNKHVSTEIQDYAKRIQHAEKKYKWLGKRGEHPIYYIGLYELFRIIEKNFNPFFKGIFDLGNLRTWINESVPIRNLLAHNIKIQPEERQNIIIRTKYICKCIENESK